MQLTAKHPALIAALSMVTLVGACSGDDEATADAGAAGGPSAMSTTSTGLGQTPLWTGAQTHRAGRCSSALSSGRSAIRLVHEPAELRLASVGVRLSAGMARSRSSMSG